MAWLRRRLAEFKDWNDGTFDTLGGGPRALGGSWVLRTPIISLLTTYLEDLGRSFVQISLGYIGVIISTLNLQAVVSMSSWADDAHNGRMRTAPRFFVNAGPRHQPPVPRGPNTPKLRNILNFMKGSLLWFKEYSLIKGYWALWAWALHVSCALSEQARAEHWP